MTMRWALRYDDHTLRDYRPHFYTPGDGLYINEAHGNLVAALAEIRGALARPDYAKLYELGYYAQGPVLEIGRLAAKSSILIAMGLRDAGKTHPFFSVDQAPGSLVEAEANLRSLNLRDRVLVVQGDSATVVAQLPIVFDSVFIDGDHSYDGVERDIFALRGKIRQGGPVLFHDYYHGANDDPENSAIKVAASVDDHAPLAGLSFRGGVGALAVYEQG